MRKGKRKTIPSGSGDEEEKTAAAGKRDSKSLNSYFKQRKSTTQNLKGEKQRVSESGNENKGKGFFACYLLTSLSPRHKGHTYIGSVRLFPIYAFFLISTLLGAFDSNLLKISSFACPNFSFYAIVIVTRLYSVIHNMPSL